MLNNKSNGQKSYQRTRFEKAKRRPRSCGQESKFSSSASDQSAINASSKHVRVIGIGM
jgi:hypothetical protein